MAVLALVKFDGDPDRLIAAIREHVDPAVEPHAAGNGARWHSVSKTERGILVADVWDDAEGMQRVASIPEVQEALRSSGLPEPQFKFHELLEYGDV